MKIVLFGNATPKNAGIRYRLLKWADRLSEDGHTCVVCLPGTDALWERLWEQGNLLTKLLWEAMALCLRVLQLRHVVGADVVFFRGSVTPFAYGPVVFERIIRWLNPRMVYDIDDAVWEPADGVSSPFLKLVNLGWTWQMCTLCEHGIVGNRYLEQHVLPHNPNVTIIPTCVDVERFPMKDHAAQRETRRVVLGWVGLHTNLVNMRVIDDVLRELARKHDLVLLVASGRDYKLDGIEVINRRWRIEHEIDYLAEADIGLMPLLDTECARGKCGFKALQYMSVGTPCVISSIGMNTEIVEDGVNGYLAGSPEEWFERLERLILDPDLRHRMGKAARQTVVERYSHQVFYPTFRSVMETVAAAGRRQ